MSNQKSATITLRASGSTMRLFALRKGDDTATTFVTTTEDATKKTQRGMTEQHPSFEAARAAIVALAEKAPKQGWTRPTVGRAFVPKPDAFSQLPAAPKATGKAK